MPTFTAANSGSSSGQGCPALVDPNRDLYPVPVWVSKIRGVVGGTVLGSLPGVPLADAAVDGAALPGGLDGRDAVRAEADVAAGSACAVATDHVEDRAHDPPRDPLLGVDLPAPAQGAEHGVVEPAASLQIVDLDADVVDHPRTLSRHRRAKHGAPTGTCAPRPPVRRPPTRPQWRG